jgi:hypothetical protein
MAVLVQCEVGVLVPRCDHTDVSPENLYGRLRRQIGLILRELYRQRGVDMLEGHARPDHIHLCLSIRPSSACKILSGS